MTVLEDHPDRTLTKLSRVSPMVWHFSILSKVGASIRPGALHNQLGVVMGVAGLVTVVPALEEVGAVFGLGLIVWFIAVGINLIQDGGRSAEQQANPRLIRTKSLTTNQTN
jgi:hypothetical protein